MILDCLKGDQTTIDNLGDLFVEAIADLASESGNIDFGSVYKNIVKDRDIEIDVESAAWIYNNVRHDPRLAEMFGSDVETFLTTGEDLNAMIEATIGKTIAKMGVPTIHLQSIKYQKLNTARALAVSLMEVLNNAKFGRLIAKTDAVKIKEHVLKFAKDVLGKPVSTTGKTVDLLADVLEKSILSNSFTGTPDQLFNELKPALDDMASRLDPVTRAYFQHEINQLKKAAFNFGITDGARKKILFDTIKASDIYGKTTASGKRVIDWDKLSSSADLDQVLQGLLSAKLDALKYTGSKQKVYDAIIGHYNTIRKANAYQKAVNVNANNKRLGQEIAISNGFYDEDKNGRKTVNYGKENKAGRARLVDILKEAGHTDTIAQGMANAKDTKPAFDSIAANYEKIKTVPQVRDAVRRLMVINNRDFKHKIGVMDRLLSMRDKGIGMDQATDALAANILGIRVRSSHIKRMQDLVDRYAEVMADPQKIYDEIAAAHPGMAYDYHGNIPLGLWASGTLERMNREMSDILIESIGDDSKLLQVMAFEEKMQRTFLSGLLTNMINIPQNIGTAITTMILAGKKHYREEKLKMFLGSVLLDAQGVMMDPEMMHREFKDWSEAQAFKDKIGALYRSITQGVLNGIDGVPYFHGAQRRFYNNIYFILRAKPGMTPTIIDSIMKPYFNDVSVRKSRAMAEYFFAKAGITPAKIGAPRFRRELEMESMRIQMSFLMAGDMSNYIGPKLIMALRDSSQRLVRFDLGKEMPYTTVGSGSHKAKDYKNNIPGLGNVVNEASKKAGAALNVSMKEFADNPNIPNGIEVFIKFMVKMFIHGGPFRFGSGILTFADKDFGSVNPLARGHALTKRYRKKYVDLIKGDTAGEEEANIDNVIRHYEEYEIYRGKNYLFVRAMTLGVLTLAGAYALAGDDDDDEGIFKNAIDAMYKLGESNPGTKLAFTRLGVLPIRFIYALMEAANSKDKAVGATKVIATLFNTGPVDMKTAVGMVFDKKEMRKGEVTISSQFAKMMAEAYFPSPIAAISNIILGPINIGMDIARGYRKPPNYNKSEALSLLASEFGGVAPKSYAINGGAIGLFGQQSQYFMQGWIGVGGGIMDNDSPRKPSYYKIYKGRKFSSVPWNEHGSPELLDGRFNVDLAYTNLKKIQTGIFKVANELGAETKYKDSKMLDNMFKRPYPGMFSVEAESVNMKKVMAIDPTIKPDAKSVNLLGLALKRLGFKLNITDVETAIKYQNFQNDLK